VRFPFRLTIAFAEELQIAMHQTLTATDVERAAGGARGLLKRGLASVDWRSITAFGLPLALYLLTAAPTIGSLDSAELTTAAATAGLTRATGYPLYLILGHLWSWLPLGDVGYRMNLFSAFNAALTMLLAERILRRLGVGPWAAFGSLGLLTCATFFWSLALVAEVYTLQTALMAGLILALVRWTEAPAPRRLAVVALVLGLSLAHHGATVLLIPGCIVCIATAWPRQGCAARRWLAAPAALLAGVSIYLYLPLRYGAPQIFNYAGAFDADGIFRPVDLRTLSGCWWLISGRAFAGYMLSYRGVALWDQVAAFGVQLWRAFFAIGLGPGVLGVIVLWRRDRRLGAVLLIMFVCTTGFFIDYQAVDKATMFLPAYLVWALWLGIGYEQLLAWVRTAGASHVMRGEVWLLRAVIVGAVLLAALWNWPLVDQSGEWSTRTRAEQMLEHAEPHALILGWWETVPALEYLQLVEGQRPDVQAINRWLITPENMQRLIAREVARRPIYIDSPPAELPANVEARPDGSLYRLWLRP
jgi:hypothetical protein